MANTTNFGWETPDDTDLVKDGAAAMRTLGSAIDTSMMDLKGGTSGQILSKNSNTDMDFVWIANDQGDITGVTASAPLTGGGTSGAITVGIQDGTTAQKGAVQLTDSTSSTSTTTAATPNSVKSAYDLADAAIAKSLVDAKGDLLVGSADNTVARLAVGTNNYVLTADSTATNGIKWAAAASGGGMTSLASGSLSSTGISLSSISSSYNNLQLWMNDMDLNSTTDLAMTFNSLSADYSIQIVGWVSSAVNSGQQSTDKVRLKYNLESMLNGDYNANLVVNFYNYASSGTKIGDWRMYYYGRYGAAQMIVQGVFNNSGANSAISSISVQTDGATFSGGSYQLWGIK